MVENGHFYGSAVTFQKGKAFYRPLRLPLEGKLCAAQPLCDEVVTFSERLPLKEKALVGCRRGRGSSCSSAMGLLASVSRRRLIHPQDGRRLSSSPFGLRQKKDGARLARRPWASSLRSLRRVWCAHRADAAELRAPSVYQIKKSERPLDVLIFLVHLQGLEPWTP